MRDPNLAMDNRQLARTGAGRSHGPPSDNTQERTQQHRRELQALNLNGAVHSDIEAQDPTGPAAAGSEYRLQPRHNGFGDVRPRTSVAPRGTTLEQLYQTQLAAETNGVEDNPVAQALNLGRPAAPLMRAKSDFGPRRTGENGSDDEDWKMRHGWEDEFTSHEYLSLLNSVSVRNYRMHWSWYLLPNI